MSAALRTLAVLAALVLGAAGARAEDTPFRAVDLVVDAGSERLAAWQVEVRLGEGTTLVGVEGGQAPFAEPAYHDPAALRSGRVVLAAFSTKHEEELPKGRVRVARLHLLAEGKSAPEALLVVAADAEGRRIEAVVTLQDVESP